MRRVGHRPASQTRCRFAADVAVALTAVTRNRTIASCCETVARQTRAQPARSPLRPPTTKCPNTHSDRGTAIAPPPAGSFPAGFRTPAPVPAASSARAGIRNPQHDLPSDQVRGMSALYRFAAMGSYEAAVSSIFRPVARPQMATARPSGTALAFAPRPSFPAFLHQEVHDCQRADAINPPRAHQPLRRETDDNHE